jgi:hypothetical protein
MPTMIAAFLSDQDHVDALDPITAATSGTTATPTNCNRLHHITDGVGTSALTTDIETMASGNFKYSEIGQLIGDISEEIDTIEWNVSGKIRRIMYDPQSSKENIEFIYGPGGNRVAKIAGNGAEAKNNTNAPTI